MVIINVALALSIGVKALAPVASPNISPIEAACLAEALYFESVGTSFKDKQGVANVILKRKQVKAYKNHVCDVIAEPYQFSYRNNNKYKAHIVPNNVYTKRSFRDIFRIVGSAYFGKLKDNTQGATHFVNLKVAKPKWANTLRRTATYEHTFFAMR